MEANTIFKGIRIAKNLSQLDFATKLHVSQGTIADIERGRIGVSKRMKKRLKDIFDIDYSIIEGQESKINLSFFDKNKGDKMKGGVKGGENSKVISPYPTGYWEDENFYLRDNFETKLLRDIIRNHPEESAFEDTLNTVRHFVYIIDNLNNRYFNAIDYQLHSAANYLEDGRFDYAKYKADYLHILDTFAPVKPALNALSMAIKTFYEQFKEFDKEKVLEGYFDGGNNTKTGK